MDGPRGLPRQIRHGHLANLMQNQRRPVVAMVNLDPCATPVPTDSKLGEAQRLLAQQWVFKEEPKQRGDLLGHRAGCHDVAQTRTYVKATATVQPRARRQRELH